MKRYLLFVALLAAAASWIALWRPSSPALAQSVVDDESPPVRVTMLDSDLADGRRTMRVELHNVSGREIVAAGIRVRSLDKDGQEGPFKTYRLSGPILGPPSVRKTFPPGHVWIETLRADERASPTVPDYIVDLDYVRFLEAVGDQSIEWGPDRGASSGRVMMARYVYRIERRRLLRLYEEQGVEALISDLTEKPAR